MEIYNDSFFSFFFFFFEKKAAVLLCTDIAAQGFGYVLYQTLTSVRFHLPQFHL